MLPADLITRLCNRHADVVTAVQRWSEAAAKGRNTEKLYKSYVNAEGRFESAVSAIVEAAKKR
jgi:hypothetical protein